MLTTASPGSIGLKGPEVTVTVVPPGQATVTDEPDVLRGDGRGGEGAGLGHAALAGDKVLPGYIAVVGLSVLSWWLLLFEGNETPAFFCLSRSSPSSGDEGPREMPIWGAGGVEPGGSLISEDGPRPKGRG